MERWHARYRTSGYAGLDAGRRSDAGGHRLPAELVELIEGLALSKPRPAVVTIHRKVRGICDMEGWPVPSYGVVRAIVGAPASFAVTGSDVGALASRCCSLTRRR